MSGGQRQRLSIARLFLRDPAVIVLDEATSDLDAETERRVLDAVTRFAADRTLIVVAHRIETITGYDEILVEKQVVAEVTEPATQIQVDIAKLDYYHLNPEVGDTITILEQPAPPSSKHPLGTDPLGRDVLSQLMYSTSSEFALGIVAALVTVIIATTVGAVAAYFGGLVDTFFMRVADLLIIMPLIPVLILLGALIHLELIHLAIIIGILSGLGGTTLIIKSQALTVKVKPFIEAARVAGGSDWHIISTHLIPNLLPLSFLYMMFTVTTAIFLEAVWSFFGLMNVNMSWGLMINTTQFFGYLLRFDTWWLLFPASIAITRLCAAF
jgi:peptide/nickel transport system permease protein